MTTLAPAPRPAPPSVRSRCVSWPGCPGGATARPCSAWAASWRALATYLVVTGLQAHAAFDELGKCVPPITTDACRIRWESFVNSHGQRGLTGPLLVVLPGVVGALVGAPLIGRELESGVFRYSWTQGAGRMRWAAAITLPMTVVTAALMGTLGLLVAWRNQPMVAAGATQRLDSSTFPTTGVAVVGWTLLAVSAGILAGLVWRRVIPAVATTFVLWFGIALLASLLRPHLMAPLTVAGETPAGSLEVSDYWTKGGDHVSVAEVSAVLEKVGVQMRDDGFSAHVDKGGPAPTDPIAYLADHGYAQVHAFQPDSRYWPFQWIELGGLVLVSVFLLWLTFWLVRRRSA